MIADNPNATANADLAARLERERLGRGPVRGPTPKPIAERLLARRNPQHTGPDRMTDSLEAIAQALEAERLGGMPRWQVKPLRDKEPDRKPSSRKKAQ